MKLGLPKILAIIVVCYVGLLVVGSLVKALTVGLVLGVIFGFLAVIIHWFLLFWSGASGRRLSGREVRGALVLIVLTYLFFWVFHLPVIGGLSFPALVVATLATLMFYLIGDVALFAVNKIR